MNDSTNNQVDKRFIGALAPLEHYLKRVDEVVSGELPARYVHLAARTLIQRPIERYSEFFGSEEHKDEAQTKAENASISRLNQIVSAINEICGSEDALPKLRNPDSEEVNRIRAFYGEAKLIIQ